MSKYHFDGTESASFVAGYFHPWTVRDREIIKQTEVLIDKNSTDEQIVSALLSLQKNYGRIGPVSKRVQELNDLFVGAIIL